MSIYTKQHSLTAIQGSMSLEEQILTDRSLMFQNSDLNEISEPPDEMNGSNGVPAVQPRIKEDLGNIILIFFLYALQGVPSGLLMSIPLILSARKVSYADQGTLSFASWPFAFKILWAPFVDTFYVKRIGRRKSWIVFVQLLMGVVVFSAGSFLNKILAVDTDRKKTG
jgi:hypothetical protein